ncbi:hypothetical protein K1T71_005483 [Dendrolimus kikuchii]|uniref:Uncharacterized protein n=1 Tax=Dendrolimus kikuchii TaxID=765133 RepID=A0ACC1D541_9NEOP|nr:hypothetical protein K1T71_005483 [Dendrolimus kikuchii]
MKPFKYNSAGNLNVRSIPSLSKMVCLALKILIKMAKSYIIFGILILQLYVNAAPNDISKLEDIATTEETAPKLDDEPTVIENENNDTPEQTVRQKRFYNYYGYGFPPINPVIYPGYGKRDQSADIGVYGANDPLDQIHQRLQEIVNIVKRPPSPPPPPTQIPIFYPVIYVPQSCVCNPSINNDTTTQATPRPTGTQEPPVPTETNQTTNPDVTLRLPDVGDEDYETEFEDNNRPISFDPIAVNRNLTRPPPPVEHGSNQAGGPDNNPTITTNRPTERPANLPNDINTIDAQFVPQAPSLCDGAVLSCCHQLYVTENCFALQGCPNPMAYSDNPCEVNAILTIIYKFQNYYAQRNG